LFSRTSNFGVVPYFSALFVWVRIRRKVVGEVEGDGAGAIDDWGEALVEAVGVAPRGSLLVDNEYDD
jgi:hypothetical protein